MENKASRGFYTDITIECDDGSNGISTLILIVKCTPIFLLSAGG